MLRHYKARNTKSTISSSHIDIKHMNLTKTTVENRYAKKTLKFSEIYEKLVYNSVSAVFAVATCLSGYLYVWMSDARRYYV